MELTKEKFFRAVDFVLNQGSAGEEIADETAIKLWKELTK